MNDLPINDNERLEELLQGMTDMQLKFLGVRLHCTSDAEAAREIGVSSATICNWGEPIKEAVQILRLDGIHIVMEMMRRALVKAVEVKISGLDSKNEKIKQQCSTELIEWKLGKAVQRNENEEKVKVTWDL